MNRLLLLILLVASLHAEAQRRHPKTSEIGFMVGASYYIGDLNPYRHYGKNTHLAYAVVHRLNLNQRFSLKSHINYTQLRGSDSQSNNATQQLRNLSFRSNTVEIGMDIELNFKNFAMGLRNAPVSPYLFAGLAFFRMNPQANINGVWVDLQPLGTEGQGTSENEDRAYNLGQIAFPFGVGLKFSLGKRAALALEWGYRRTTTDYLDDVSTTYANSEILAETSGPLAAQLANRSVSPEGVTIDRSGLQRGNSNSNDWYVMSGATFTFKLGKKNVCPLPL